MSERNFVFTQVEIPGLIVIQPATFSDNRGSFREMYDKSAFSEYGIPEFAQSNESSSSKGVIRGLHFQRPTWQGKLVHVSKGKVFDVALDLRVDSKTFGHWHGLELSAENGTIFYIPEGFAHGFMALEDSVFSYMCTTSYAPREEGTIYYGDAALRIPWIKYASIHNIEHFNVSSKDTTKAMTIDQYRYKYA